jgi:hypothetical protein
LAQRLVTLLDDVMTRRFLDDIRTEVNSRIADNDIGAIDAADIRNPLQDIIDSTIQDEAGLTNDAQTQVSVSVGSSWVSIDDALSLGVYDTVIGGDATFLIPDLAAGSITSTATAGFSYNAKGAVQLDAGTNVVVECAIGMDGVPGDLIGSIVGTNGVRFQGVYVERYVPSVPSSSAFTLMLRAPAGTTSVDLTVRTFGVIILPTNNP